MHSSHPSHYTDQDVYFRESLLIDFTRLNGDYNPLHATPEPGKMMGFGGVILHGLIAWNISAHAVLRTLCNSDGTRLREFSARFAAPVKGGDKLIIDIWKMDPIEGDDDGWVEVRFQTKIEGGKVCLKSGRAVVRPVQEKDAIRSSL
jgi:peroxisomal enoyl-CoA hydratase 2